MHFVAGELMGFMKMRKMGRGVRALGKGLWYHLLVPDQHYPQVEKTQRKETP